MGSEGGKGGVLGTVFFFWRFVVFKEACAAFFSSAFPSGDVVGVEETIFLPHSVQKETAPSILAIEAPQYGQYFIAHYPFKRILGFCQAIFSRPKYGH